ncbi:MAG: hypothetical protein FWG53_05375 [Clostridiales bacterium]|nr:hypothetical protein [Clostridiales bacterium]
MNYEEFYQDLQALEKGVQEKLQGTQKSFKSIAKNSANGDLKNLAKGIAQLKVFLSETEGLAENLEELAGSFNGKEYIESGDFAMQLVEYCEQYSVDVTGEFPVYEIFPYKVRIDAENQELSINKKKLQCARPLKFVQDIKASREKYLKAPFNDILFLNELAAAYDLDVAVKEKKNKGKSKGKDVADGHHLMLTDLYGYMAPTQRAKKEYDMQNFAFDLARLYSSEIKATKDDRRYEFGPSKAASKQIRILDGDGKEQMLGTVRFYKDGQ